MSEEESSPMLGEMVGQLRQTADAFEPALRYQADTRKRQAWGASAIKLNYVLAVALILVGAVAAFSTYAALTKRIEYFAADHGSYLSLVPLSEPYVGPAEVVQFARDTVSRSFSLDFSHYREDLEGVRSDYTEGGFKSFLTALDNAGILEKVRKQRFNLSSSTETGVITQEGVDNGVHVWIIQMPLQFRFVGQNSELPVQRFLANLRVERTSSLESVRPIRIAQIVTAPMGSNQ